VSDLVRVLLEELGPDAELAERAIVEQLDVDVFPQHLEQECGECVELLALPPDGTRTP
jgi:hypothetical protein